MTTFVVKTKQQVAKQQMTRTHTSSAAEKRAKTKPTAPPSIPKLTIQLTIMELINTVRTG